MSDSDDPIFKLVNDLPGTSVTGAVLHALDWIAPGQWKNITNFDELIADETGESDQDLIQQVGQRAIQLYTDPANGYQKAVWCFQMVDSLDKTIAAASAVNLIGQKFDLGFLKAITPQPEAAQAVDAGIKFACELASFVFVNGIPGDGVADFARAIGSYGKSDIMRLAAFAAIDCVLPLGPNFMEKITAAVSGSSLTESKLYNAVARYLPGGGPQEHKALIQKNLEQAGGKVTQLVQERGITQSGVLDKVRERISLSDDKLDVVAAALDVMTSYYEHTGVQSVARRVISRAYSEI
ncbi:hypothetical protein AB3662_17900 [Sorangium cellulosum]|uniref:hypothetical protein n=1 Tax=Sorangium cellulosum TaxID=56 RepID=UPI003D9A6AEC